MREELLEAILHSYRSLREEINKLRNEISQTQMNLATIKNLIKGKVYKSNRKDELKTPTELSITTPQNTPPLYSPQVGESSYSLESTTREIKEDKRHNTVQMTQYLNKTFAEIETRLNNELLLNTNPRDI